MEVHIDSITLDIISKRLKNVVNPMTILKWLNNFDKDETKYAIDYLKRFTIYTSNEIEEIFNEGLASILKNLPKKKYIVIHPIGQFGKSGSMMSYLIKKTKTLKNNPVRIKLCESSTLLKNFDSNHLTLVLIDDFVGSGQSINDYYESYLKDMKSYFKNVIFLGVAGMEQGIIKIKKNIDEIHIPNSNIYKKAFSSDASFFGYRDFENHRELAHKYGSKLTKETILKSGKSKHLEALGYSNSQSLVGFFYGCPNNTLPIFWQERDCTFKWEALLPRFNEDKISKAREFRKSISFELSLLQEFGTSQIQREFISYEIKRGKKIYNSVNHIDFSLYAILKLLREGNNEFNICHKLGIMHSDYLEYLDIGKTKGIFIHNSEISLKGLELYDDAKKCIKNSFAFKYENKIEFTNKEVNYIPKTFNGRS